MLLRIWKRIFVTLLTEGMRRAAAMVSGFVAIVYFSTTFFQQHSTSIFIS
jgi:hypothetical protein